MKYFTTTGSPPGFIALLFGAMMLGLVSQGALAAGTLSGTTISNSATLDYSVGGFGQAPVTSAPSTFVVDNKVNLTVSKLADATILPNSTNQVLYFQVTNNGNTNQSYALSTSVNGVPTATMTNIRIYNDNGATPGVYDGTNTLYVAGAATVAPDGNIKVLVLADQTAPTAVNGNTAAYNLIAQTTNAGTATITANNSGTGNTAGVDVVWADIAGSEATDTATDGRHSAFATYTVAITVPTVVKTAALLCDPYTATLANAKNIPGAMTQWTITVNNPGATPVILTTISDALTNVTLDPGQVGSLTAPVSAATCVPGAAGPTATGFHVTASANRNIGGTVNTTSHYFTSANDADGVDENAGTITATFATVLPVDGAHPTAGQLNAGETVTIIFNTTVN
ncbi:MAG TPA: hypothetical protein VMJ33_02800 [Gallionella sp.]|nr:hypothetical protein [Gallionella sp.]